MNIEIKRLTPDLTEDYIDYFDHVAFTDNEEWAGCYCVWYHWNELLEAECNEYMTSGGTDFRRELARRFIQNDTLQGYLAYVDGCVVGWCNANNKTGFDSLSKDKRPELWGETGGNDKVKAIVCYTIAPNMRRKGIATKLLKRVCEDARAEGYSYVEAYPGTSESNVHRNYHGPYALYEKCGFTHYKDLKGEAIVRKYF